MLLDSPEIMADVDAFSGPAPPTRHVNRVPSDG